MELNAKYEICFLLTAILQPAIAGGIEEEKAKEIYNQITEAISNVHKSENQFNTLLEDLINKWAIPIINKAGIKIDILDTGIQEN